MVEFTIRIGTETKAAITQAAIERECSLSDIAREVLRDWAARQRSPERRQWAASR
jgi:predicted HicB family RNase H-like nuclease